MFIKMCRFSLVFLFSVQWLSAVIIKIPPPPATPTLQQLTQRAGFIFAGTVLSVERVPAKSQNEVPSVRITFRIDQAVRGVASRQIFTLREWAGLWNDGDRYRRGEQVLLFLYQPSKLGLNSPVNGNYGRFKLDTSGRILLSAARLAALGLNTPVSPTASSGITSINGRDLVRAIQRAGD